MIEVLIFSLPYNEYTVCNQDLVTLSIHFRSNPHLHLQYLFMLLTFFAVVVSLVAPGGPASDCGVDFWDGGEVQPGCFWRWR